MTRRRIAALHLALGITHVLLGCLLLLPVAAIIGFSSLQALARLPYGLMLLGLLMTVFPLWILVAGIRMCRGLTPRTLRVLQIADSLAAFCSLLLFVSGLLALQAADDSAARGGGLLGGFGLIQLALGALVGCLAAVSLWLLRYLRQSQSATIGKKPENSA